MRGFLAFISLLLSICLAGYVVYSLFIFILQIFLQGNEALHSLNEDGDLMYNAKFFNNLRLSVIISIITWVLYNLLVYNNLKSSIKGITFGLIKDD